MLPRGIDISDVQAVISLNLPSDLDYYFPSGRPGRDGFFGKKATAISSSPKMTPRKCSPSRT
jgi:superfamily II DNA/RNA helicase